MRIKTATAAGDGPGGTLLGRAQVDLKQRLERSLVRSVESWAVEWFDSSAVERDARAIVAPLPEKIAAEVVESLARIAAGPNGADYE